MRIRLPSLRWVVAAATLFVTSCGPAGLQRQDQFAWAIKEGLGSTSPPIVRVRVSDKPSGAGSIRCVYSDTLIDAIRLEKGMPFTQAGYEKAVSIALASHDHSFRFANPAAQKVMTATRGMMDAGLSKGCKLIEQGKSALWGDMEGTVVEGPDFPIANGTR